ncbi:hypothetical protein ACIGKG_04690 [Streptomyces rochei]|uniref:hypothetical protein n=1 Tax=Streptomyces rochei TaxID=1928 RepID=UPI0037D4BFFA
MTDQAGNETTADKAARLGMTPEEYRANRHRSAVGQIRAALPFLYATTGLRVEAALTEPTTETQADAMAALTTIHRDMDTARRGGDEWASEWFGDVWSQLPLSLRAAAGDEDAADELAAEARRDGAQR